MFELGKWEMRLLFFAGVVLSFLGLDQLGGGTSDDRHWVGVPGFECENSRTLGAALQRRSGLEVTEELENARGTCEGIGMTFSGHARCLSGAIQVICIYPDPACADGASDHCDEI